ncbi:MAG: thioredoxin domain-containing protein [Kiritimatiellae bacterium]|nr:thioredoxin domain-containing protein [Kiritimatiellia bacterium]
MARFNAGVIFMITAIAATHLTASGDSSVPSGEHRFTNRLVQANSPYLLQHAHNPVDWYPWGEEALAKAKKENKPIFLSIGYSACHWCHVMERESFEDGDIAEILNRDFVSIKVDREERPDVDAVYMDAVQMMTGSGGWPLTVFLTPDLHPFFGGTYFPPDDRYGRPGFKKLLEQIVALWRDENEDVLKQAKVLGERLSAVRSYGDSAEGAPGALTAQAVDVMRMQFDPQWGGFGRAPKFPSAAAMNLLLRHVQRTGNKDSRRMLEVTLDRMAAGGMYDQVGGGFHRYSVDHEWLVPHFEKMLYDNALLAGTYTDAWLVTERKDYQRVAREIFDYILRDMRDPCGAFHASEDADSEGHEGIFYIWSREEILKILGEKKGAQFCAFYGVSKGANFEGKNILHVPQQLATFAEAQGITITQLNAQLAGMRKQLLRVRSKRVRPAKDDKIIVSWNALMISAFARGFQVFGEQRYRQAAEAAASHILDAMLINGKLWRTWRAGKVNVPGFLEDYGAFANALLDLHEATLEPRWLSQARMLIDEMVKSFWDEKDHGFFQTSARHDRLPARLKPYYDASVPSGNALAALACARLARFSGDARYARHAEETFVVFGRLLKQHPSAVYQLLAAAEFHRAPSREIVLSGKKTDPSLAKLQQVVWGVFDPDRIVTGHMGGKAKIYDWPLFSGREPTDTVRVFLCENFSCRKPMTQADEVDSVLRRMAKGHVESAWETFERKSGSNQE